MKAYLSPVEASATIKNSNLITVVTEGKDDYTVFRKLEECLSDLGASLLPLTGKSSVIEVWRKLNTEERRRTFFIVDRDVWIYTGIPEEYNSSDFATTSGYSIENDIYQDGELINLCSANEREAFHNELELVCRWHATKLPNMISGINCEIDYHPNRIMAEGAVSIQDMNDNELNWYDRLCSEYQDMLRGKTLMQTLMRQLNYRGRVPKYSYSSLLEMGAARHGPKLQAIEAKIRAHLG